MQGFLEKLFGKLLGYRAYLSKALLFWSILLVTKLLKNMKTKLVTPMADAIVLRKQAICETIIDQLKKSFRLSIPGIATLETS